VENKIAEFLRIEQKALEARIAELKSRLAYTSELLCFAEINDHESKPTKSKSGDSLVEDMLQILESHPGEAYCATELFDLLKDKWEKHPSIGKQNLQKRVWGTMNYMRSKSYIKATKRGRTGYLAYKK